MAEYKGQGLPNNSLGVNGDTYARQTTIGVESWVKTNNRWSKSSGSGGSASGVTSVNGQTGVVLLDLGDLGDVSVPSPTDGQVLTWDTMASSWVAATVPSSGIADSFETVSKNLIAWRYTINYNIDDTVDTIVYTDGFTQTITKTFNYTGDKLTSIVLSGDTPAGIDLTKTFTYTGDVITTVAYT